MKFDCVLECGHTVVAEVDAPLHHSLRSAPAGAPFKDEVHLSTSLVHQAVFCPDCRAQQLVMRFTPAKTFEGFKVSKEAPSEEQLSRLRLATVTW